MSFLLFPSYFYCEHELANTIANNSNAIDNSQLLAAIDIGSNSFHLIVARNVLGALHVCALVRDVHRTARLLGRGVLFAS